MSLSDCFKIVSEKKDSISKNNPDMKELDVLCELLSYYANIYFSLPIGDTKLDFYYNCYSISSSLIIAYVMFHHGFSFICEDHFFQWKEKEQGS